MCYLLDKLPFSPYHSPSFLSSPHTSGVHTDITVVCLVRYCLLLSVFAGTRLTKTSMSIKDDVIFQHGTKLVENVIHIDPGGWKFDVRNGDGVVICFCVYETKVLVLSRC